MSSTADDRPNAEFLWSADEHRRVGREVTDWIATYLTSLPTAPVFQPVPTGAAAAMLAAPVPQAGEPIDAILHRFEQDQEFQRFGQDRGRRGVQVCAIPNPL